MQKLYKKPQLLTNGPIVHDGDSCRCLGAHTQYTPPIPMRLCSARLGSPASDLCLCAELYPQLPAPGAMDVVIASDSGSALAGAMTSSAEPAFPWLSAEAGSVRDCPWLWAVESGGQVPAPWGWKGFL